MLRKLKLGLCLMALPYCVPVAVADPATGGAKTSSGYEINVPGLDASLAKAIKDGTATPEQYFEAADMADKADDMIASAALYRFAADGGHAIAQVRTGDILYGTGVFDLALNYFLKAAEQDNTDGMYGAAVVLMGRYSEKDIKGDLAGNDYVAARKWLSQAADMGHSASLIKMAEAYIFGGLGLDKDALNSPDALSWIKRAADADHIPAVDALVKAYRTGQYGLAADPAKADELEAKANKLKGIKTKSGKQRSRQF